MWTGAAVAATFVALMAPVPPQDCGRMELRGTTYQVKADELRCVTARRYAKRYVVTRRRPSSSWTCRRYPSTTKLAFRCRSGDRTFFGIRRS